MHPAAIVGEVSSLLNQSPISPSRVGLRLQRVRTAVPHPLDFHVLSAPRGIRTFSNLRNPNLVLRVPLLKIDVVFDVGQQPRPRCRRGGQRELGLPSFFFFAATSTRAGRRR